MKHVGQDFRFAFRSLRKRPGFALLIIATLALCIGANSAIFSIVDAALLHGLPFRDSDRLVSVSEILSSVMSGPIPFSVPDYVQLTQHSRSFEQAGIYDDHGYELSGIGEPQNVHATRISASLFPTLGMSPALGRNFTEQEDTHHHHVAILSGSFWRSKFNADPRILGKTVLLDRIPYTIVGVMAGNTPFPLRGPAFNNEPADLYVPISFTKEELQGWGNMYNNSVIARLRPAVSIGQARAEVKALIHRIYWESYPADHRSTSSTLDADVISLRTEVVGPVEPILLVLFGAVGLVLLIGCADIAGLMLTRAAARTREMSIRAALGATRPDLIRQVLIESVLLAAAGGAAGALVAFWFRDALVRFATVNLPITGSASSSLTLIAFTAALAMLTALLFGIFPALQASLVEVNVGLREGGRGQSLGPKRARVLDALVTAQFALALILLIGAGLLARSFSRLIATNPGFRPDHTLTMSVSLPASAYSKGAQVLAFYERLQGALETTPGVKDAAVATSLPLAINEHRTFAIDGQEPQTLDIPRSVAQIWTLGNFFQTMGIPLERGRLFDRRDSRNSPSVAIINTRLANKFWPGENPLGKRIKWGDNNSKRPWMMIVGVVGDVKQGALSEDTDFETYTPYAQVSDNDLADNVTDEFRSVKLALRTGVSPERMAAAIERKVHELDPSLPVTSVKTMDTALHESTRAEQFNTVLLGVFAAAAITLAALGIAGVMAYSVAQRVAEIGVRLALGASKLDVIKLVLKRGMQMALTGGAIGLMCSLAVTRLMRSLLYQTSPLDVWALLGAAAVLSTVALASLCVPAQRAAAVDPVQSLRVE